MRLTYTSCQPVIFFLLTTGQNMPKHATLYFFFIKMSNGYQGHFELQLGDIASKLTDTVCLYIFMRNMIYNANNKKMIHLDNNN